MPFPLSHILEPNSSLIFNFEKNPSREIAGINTCFEIRNGSQELLFQTNKSVAVHMKTDKHCEAAEDRAYFLQEETGIGIFPSIIVLKKYSVLQ